MQDSFQNQVENIRPGDFQKAWPTALSVAMRQASELVGQLEQTNRSIAETKDRVVGLAKLVPAAIAQAEGRLNLAVNEVTLKIASVELHLVDASQASITELNRAVLEAQSATLELNRQLMIEQRAFLIELKEEKLALIRTRTDTDAAMVHLAKVQKNLEDMKKALGSKTFWQRLFSKT